MDFRNTGEQVYSTADHSTLTEQQKHDKKNADALSFNDAKRNLDEVAPPSPKNEMRKKGARNRHHSGGGS